MRCVQPFEVDWINSIVAGTAAPLVIDVGANEGEYTEMVLRRWPEAYVWCVEPNPLSVRALAAHWGERVTIIEAALSSEDGQAPLFFDDLNGADLTASLHQRDLAYQDMSHGSQATMVRTCRMDSVFAPQEIDLLKIDVEGHEIEVLRGGGDLIDPVITKRIQFEFNSCALDSRVFFKDFWDLLVPRGYHLHQMEQDGLRYLGDRYSPTMEDFAAQRDFVAQGQTV